MQPLPNAISFTLPSNMTAETAESLTEALMQLPLGKKPSVTLDASQVESLSSSGAQILLALKKSVLAADGELEIVGRKHFLTEVFQEMGFDWLLNTLR